MEQQRPISMGRARQLFYTTGNVAAFAEMLKQLVGTSGMVCSARWNDAQLEF
jgi:hypothetical protein